jgi:GTPase SAR1 family protein
MEGPVEVKVCIIGDSDVGKTSLSMRYMAVVVVVVVAVVIVVVVMAVVVVVAIHRA